MSRISLIVRVVFAAAAIISATIAPIANAGDGTVARLVEVKGNVLVSRDFVMASADEALRLLPDSRVLTTGNAAAVVQYDNGCRVRLTPNQRFHVDVAAPCAMLAAEARGNSLRAAGFVTSTVRRP